MHGRQLALHLLMAHHKEGVTLQNALNQLDISDQREYRLGREIAWGTLRYKEQLSALLLRLNEGKPLRIKAICKMIGYMALYQYLYMESVPLFAIVNESVALAKKVCRPQAPFLNALLRKMEQLPSVESLKPHEQVSMPQYLYEKLASVFDLTCTLTRSCVMLRSTGKKDLPLIQEYPHCHLYQVEGSLLPHLTIDAYVQNRTPIDLVYHLYDPTFEPLRVLDLCASPGGKLSLAGVLFPSAQLFANDLYPAVLKENVERLQLDVEIREGDGRDYPEDQMFDLIILDLPCSGTGVLNKKPEAKYRLNDDELAKLKKLQCELIEKAITLLSDVGQLWVMTCSVLPEENEAIYRFATEQCHLKVRQPPLTIYPNQAGVDGGYSVMFTTA